MQTISILDQVLHGRYGQSRLILAMAQITAMMPMPAAAGNTITTIRKTAITMISMMIMMRKTIAMTAQMIIRMMAVLTTATRMMTTNAA